MKIRFIPKKLQGCVIAPPSKSMVHRAVLCCAFCKEPTTLFPISFSKDFLATAGAVEALGARICKNEDNSIRIFPTQNLPKTAQIDCNESGSTLRFLLPIVYALGVQSTFLMRPSLAQRPTSDLIDLLVQSGATYQDNVLSGKLQAGSFSITGAVSSQYITGLLFALSLLCEPSELIVSTPLQSKGYVDLTLAVFEKFGVQIQTVLPTTTDAFAIKYCINPVKNLWYTSPHTLLIESDFSNLAFWLAASVLGSDVTCTQVSPHSLQPDYQIISILKQFGANIKQTADAIFITPAPLKGCNIDVSQCPDIAPILAIVATQAQGSTTLYGASRLKIKECDRFHAIVQTVEKMGVSVLQTQDSITIYGGTKLCAGNFDAFNDHRIAMCLAIASTIASGPIEVSDFSCVEKSYPDFLNQFVALGGCFDVI